MVGRLRDAGYDLEEDARYLRLRQRGAERRLLDTPLRDLTLGQLVDLLRDLDQTRWLRERGLDR